MVTDMPKRWRSTPRNTPDWIKDQLDHKGDRELHVWHYNGTKSAGSAGEAMYNYTCLYCDAATYYTA